MAKRAPGDRNPPLAVRLGHSEGWKPPKVGGFTWIKSPWNCNSGHLARDTAIFQFPPAGHARGPTGPFGVQRTPFWGQTGPNMAKSGPKRYPTVFFPSTMASGPPTAPHGGTTAHFGRFWAILAPSHPGPKYQKIWSNGHPVTENHS